MRALALLVVLAVLLSGCASTTTTTTDASGSGVAGRSLGTAPVGGSRPDEVTVTTQAADDPRAPPLSLGNASATAAVYLVKESTGRAGNTTTRYACGGALLAVPSGDARPDLATIRYLSSERLVDERGRAWVTDRYATVDGRTLWISNVGGSEEFRADNERYSCKPWSHEGHEYNVLLHAKGVETVDAWFAPDERPGCPDERTWAEAA